ncbi:uncharacterized protein CDV56_104500 [Aspergillus thermomutatus]|uniref:O-methyltransferase C-terminal domain-containing protein n=1 Tax=Aspergillus thermomutatus TaxID=41047 RepID=A0A397G5V3_ASPTH|nr:uncharacterized protein CDV56_104500 [Aspergillus thermomutatus]RHZ46421.1 hypothetical protein CDV56_104500 [Aspergillus thermomutatus]
MSQHTDQISQMLSLVECITQEAQSLRTHSSQQDSFLGDKFQRIITACNELSACLTMPELWMTKIAMGYSTSVAISLALEMNLHQHIQINIPTSLDTLVQHTGGSKKLITSRTFYDYIREIDTIRGARFDTAMEATALDPSLEMTYPFASLSHGAVVVDVGGGRGHHCRRLMRQFRHIQFIVQDHEDAVKNLSPIDEAGDEHRISWQGHNFFDPQPVKGADVYLLNSVLMDHHDKCRACKIILRNIANAMVPGHSTCLVSDGIEPENELSPLFSAHQLHMISILSRAYRSQSDWEKLFHEADERLLFEKIFSSGTGKVIYALRLRETDPVRLSG